VGQVPARDPDRIFNLLVQDPGLLVQRPRQRLDPGTQAIPLAAHRLLATGLSPHAYAQAMTVVALEEVLDRREGWVRGRHSNDYWVAVFGDPAGDGPGGWRFEGHHLSVSLTVHGDDVSPAPVFLGANPARVSYAGRPVVRPLAPEEDLARELLDAAGPDSRGEAIVSETAPADIRSSVKPRWATSFATSASGITPTTSPPAARAASASSPISPTQPPP